MLQSFFHLFFYRKPSHGGRGSAGRAQDCGVGALSFKDFGDFCPYLLEGSGSFQTPHPEGEAMGRTTGFEPATLGSTIQCSNQLSYVRHKEIMKEEFRLNLNITHKRVELKNSSLFQRKSANRVPSVDDCGNIFLGPERGAHLLNANPPAGAQARVSVLNFSEEFRDGQIRNGGRLGTWARAERIPEKKIPNPKRYRMPFRG